MAAQPPLPPAQRTLDLPAQRWHQHLIGRYILGRDLDTAPHDSPGLRRRWQEQFPRAYQDHPDVQHAGRSYAAIAEDVHADLLTAILTGAQAPRWFGLPRLTYCAPVAHEKHLTTAADATTL